MSLQTVLEGISRESRLPFLRKAYRPERQDVAEALLSQLEPNLRNGSDFYRKDERREFNEVIGTLIRQAGEAGDTERVNALRFQQITSYFYADDIEAAAKGSENPDLISKVVDNYRGDHWHNWGMVMNLLEHLGREDEAREYALEAVQVLDERRKRFLNGGKWANHNVDRIYMRLGMFKEAVEVRLDNKDFDEAIKLAQEHLSREELPQLYQRVFDNAEGEGHDNGFPVQVRIAKLLGDEELERATKKKYVDWVMSSTDEAGYLSLIREVGTEQQLSDMHERIVTFYQQDGFHGLTRGRIRIEPKSLAEAAGEAYQDTQEVKYAGIAMETYEKIGDFPKALEFARVADPKKAEVLERAASLIE